jgi:uncharacterized protein
MILRLLLLAMLLVSPIPAQAIDIPPPPDHYVTDQANLLSPALKAQLEEGLAAFERDSSNQVLVATFPSLGGDSIEDFGIRLSERWRPGQGGRDNGIILLVSKEDKKARIEVGYGLEGAVPDAVARSILQTQILPRFKAGDFDGGVKAGLDAIIQATRGEYQGQGNKIFARWWLAFLIVLVIVAFLLIFSGSYGLSSRGHYRGGGHWGGWGGGGYGGGGGGGWSSGSGGGFSGGGGSFGGGGASGGW